MEIAAAESPLTPITTITGPDKGDNFGWNASWVGDVNGDGFDDIIVGAPYADRTPSADWWDTNWSYRRKLTFDNSAQSEELVNFPVLINLSSLNFDYFKVKSDGTDLRFIDADTVTELKYHIEDWNTSGNSYVWVNVTSIDAGSSTDYIWMYYGNPDALDVQDVGGTYDANYVGVWHLNETGIGTRYDATSNDNDGSPQNYDGDEAITGKIDGADELDGTNDHILISDSASLSFGAGSSFTLEVWVNAASFQSSGSKFVEKKTTLSEYYRLNAYPSNNLPEFGVRDSDNVETDVYGTTTINDSQWHHIVGVKNGNNLYIYVDGVQENSSSASYTGNWDDGDVRIGYSSDGGASYLDGLIDEIRISDVARSSEWIAAQYISMNNIFISFGEEEIKDWWDNTWAYRRKLTFDNSGQSEDLVNFPVLVNLNSSNFDYSKSKPDGTDLRFLDTDCSTELKYHIEDWNPSGNSSIWVNVTDIAAGSQTDYIWMYYGNPGASSVQDVAGTYEDSFKMVQHLNETSGTHFDATNSDNDGFPQNGLTQDAQGRIDGADDFNGVLNYLDAGSAPNIDNLGNVTFQAWVFPRSIANWGSHVINKRGGSPPPNGWRLVLANTLRFDLRVDFATTDMIKGSTDNSIVLDTWQHIAFTWDGSSNASNVRLYVNGQEVSYNLTQNGVGSRADDDANTLWIGTCANVDIAQYSFDGRIDEVQVLNATKSADWIRAQHLSMNRTFISFGSEETKSWWNLDWDYRKKLVFDNSGQSEDLVNFPVLVKLDISNFDFSKAKLDGTDLRFVDNDGVAELNYEIESWNSTANSYVWVNVTNIAAGSSTDYIWMYYGNSGALDVQDVSGTYNSNYMGVWHLNESSGNALDSTSYSTDGTPSGGVTQGVAGPIDGAYEFDGSTGSVGVPDPADGHLDFGYGNLTVSFWVNIDQSTGNFQLLIEKGGSEDIIPGYEFETAQDGGDFKFCVADGTNLYMSPLTFISFDNWMYFVGVIDRANDRLRLYMDGTEIGSATDISSLGDINNTDSLFIGSDYYTDGRIDEVRISNVARTDDWISAQYLTHTNSFIAYGNEESIKEDCGAAYLFFGYPGITLNNISANNANVTIYGSNSGDLFGWSVSDAGDLNNDGYDDIIIGAPGWGADKGRAYIFYGRPTASWNSVYDADNDADVIMTGENDGDKFGFSVSSVGDMNKFYPFDEWLYRKKITINSNQVAGNLTDFPVLINITDSDLKNKARTDGYDILFTADDAETKLDHEIESYNSSTGELIAWVRIPNLSSTVDTVIYMYYGNPGASDQQNLSGVWDSNYTMVHHLNESTGTTSYDSTDNSNDGTIQNSISLDITGKIGKGYQFDDTPQNQRVQLPSVGNMAAFTMEIWARPSTGEEEAVWGRDFIYDGWTGNAGITLNSYNSSRFGVTIPDGQSTPYNYISINGMIETAENAWNFLVATYNGSALSFYVNGQEVADSPKTGLSSPCVLFNAMHYLGFNGHESANGEKEWFDGMLDEARLSDITRSAAWINTSFNNQNDTSSFYNVSTEQINLANWYFRKMVTIDSSQVTADLTDFPLLVSITDTDLKNGARSDGNDIVFTGADGNTKLDFEIESYNGSSGELVAWVRILTLLASADTEIYMYYGKSDQSFPLENPTGVWDENYTGVWHLNETSTTPGGIKDSTSFDNDGSKYGDTILGAAGKIGKAADFDGNQDSVEIPSSDSLNNFTAFTIEAWISIDTNDYFASIVSKPWDQWETSPYDVYLISLGEIGNNNVGVGVATGGTCDYTYSAADSISTTGFYHVVGVWDGSELQNYVNGTASGSATGKSGSINYNDENISIGRYSQGWPDVYDFDGIIDEVRISNINRSSEWIATSYNNQNNSNLFYMVGPEEQNNNYEDIIIGAYGYGNNQGRAYVFFSGPDLTGSLSAVNASIIIDGDAVGDRLGWDVSGASDLDRDGFEDLIIGAPGNNSDTGAVYIFFGDDSIPSPINANQANVTLNGGSVGDEFGFSVSDAKDVNDDGYDDVIVGSPGNNSNTGTAYLFYGNDSMNPIINAIDANIAMYGNSTGDKFGFSVHHAGDLNGDGVPDVVVGAPYYDDGATTDAGAVYVFEGGALMDNTSDWSYKGEQINDHFGWSVSYAGDVNDDGLINIIVGAPHNDDGGVDAGKAYILTTMTSKPVITGIMATPSTVEIGGYVNITCTVTALNGVDEVWVNITYPNSSWIRFSMLPGGGSNWYYNTIFSDEGIHSYTVWANDTIGNWTESGIFQFEVVNNIPIFLTPQVDPPTGYNDTGFNFTVTYLDIDNHSADTITVNITNLGILDMLEVDPLDLNFADGKYYYRNITGLSNGTSYSYHFAANDTIGDWNETLPIAEPLVLNTLPSLLWPDVDPPSGTDTTNFNFTVTYLDIDNHSPGNITLNLTGPSGGIFDLLPVDPFDFDYSDGKEYYYNTTLSLNGTYSFHIAANDSQGFWVETSEIFDAPLVGVSKPILTEQNVTPSSGYVDSWFNFTVNYSHPFDKNPDNKTLNLSGPLGGVYYLLEVDPSDTNISDGKLFYCNITNLSVGSYSFHFAINDTDGNWSESGTVDFDILNRPPTLSSFQVTPTVGYIDSGFNFTVNYIDPDNHEPYNITVNITGMGVYDLLELDPLDTDYTDGKEYYCIKSGFAVGQYSFHFAANDTIENWTETGILQFNVINRQPSLSSPEVTPLVGYIDTGFNFTVNYKDPDNHAPYNITVNITGVGVYDLIEVDPLDVDYTDGKEYYYNASGFAVGLYSFHFAANDIGGDWNESGVLQFDVLNREPMLSLGQVDPTTGFIDTWFNFTVMYTDSENHPPDIISVNITGVGIYNLIELDTLDTDYTDSKIYYYNVSGFAIGSYTFHFAANDTMGNWTETGILQFDVLNRWPKLSLEQVDPTTGSTDTWFNFTVTYTDIDDHYPYNITVNITGVGIYDLVEIDPLDVVYSDGKGYYYNVSGFVIGSYTFNFAANDTQGDWIESVIMNFDVIDNVPSLLFEQVDPIVGYTESWFNFTVTYADLDNQAPVTITMNITGIGVYGLIEVDPLDIDYTDGKDYYLNLSGFGVGSYTIHFAANDTIGNWVESGILRFDVLNRAPMLSLDGVDPTTGYTDTWFNFTVSYTDLDNHPPYNITLNLSWPSGGIFDLVEVDPSDTDYIDGKEYYLNTTLTGGFYSFHFAANDSLGLWAIDTTEINAPDVIPKHGVLVAVDSIEEFSDDIYLTATLLDDFSNPISDENVAFYIDINKNGIYEAEEYAGVGTTLADGSVMVNYIGDLAPDTYNFTAIYIGSGNYVVDDGEALLTINAKQATLSIKSDVADEGEVMSLTAMLIDSEGDPIAGERVAFYIDKNKNGIYEGGELIGLITTLVNGTASITYTVDVDPENYGILARYVGSANYSVSEIEGLLTVQNIGNIPPSIKDIVPNQIKPEDSPPWPLGLTIYESDIEDTGPDLRWYLTGVDTTLYSVTGMNSSDDVLTFIPVPNAFGNDEVILWLWDSSGDRVSQILWINITPDNDPPYFDPYPPNLYVHYDDPSTAEDDPDPWDYTFYVHDVETPVEDLIITTSQPTVDLGEGYAKVDGLRVTFHYPQSRVGESIPVFLTLFDGTDAVQAMIVVNVTSDWVPQLVSKLPDVVLEENSTLYNVFDLDDYFVDRDEDSLYFSSGYFNIRVDINENNTVDITALGHWTGTELVTFRARDPIGAIAEDTITVTVIPVNDPPEISGVPDLFVHHDYSYAFDLSPYISDPDNITSELLIWTSESTDYIWLQPYNSLGIVVNYPESMNGTTILVTIFVSDGNEITSQQIQITITNNFPPELIYNLPDVFFDEDTFLWNAFRLSDYFLDIDSDILYYTNGTKFINATINANLTVDFSAPENWCGFEIVTFRATDETGALVEDKILVVVVPVNDAPTMESLPKQEKEEGEHWLLDLSQYIDDVDNNATELIITVYSEVGQGYVTLVGTVLMFQYPEGIREDVITITISDGELEATRSFIVSIKSSPVVVPTLWDLIPWPWVFLFLIGTISGAFAYYKKKSRYWVYEAFLIHEDGLPMAHISHEARSDLEDVVVSGMFTAVQNFINDTFSDQTSEKDWELDKMEFGDHKILIERSQHLYLAVIFEGYGPKLRSRVKKLLFEINEEYGKVLEDWDGVMAQLEGIKAMTASLITKKRSKNLESESLPAQPQSEPQAEEFEDVLNGWEDTKKGGVEELNEYLESVEKVLPEIVGAEETEPEEVEVLVCPICGKEIEGEDTKCSRCGVEFEGIKDVLPSSPQELEDEEPKKIPKEDENSKD